MRCCCQAVEQSGCLRGLHVGTQHTKHTTSSTHHHAHTITRTQKHKADLEHGVEARVSFRAAISASRPVDGVEQRRRGTGLSESIERGNHLRIMYTNERKRERREARNGQAKQTAQQKANEPRAGSQRAQQRSTHQRECSNTDLHNHEPAFSPSNQTHNTTKQQMNHKQHNEQQQTKQQQHIIKSSSSRAIKKLQNGKGIPTRHTRLRGLESADEIEHGTELLCHARPIVHLPTQHNHTINTNTTQPTQPGTESENQLNNTTQPAQQNQTISRSTELNNTAQPSHTHSHTYTRTNAHTHTSTRTRAQSKLRTLGEVTA